MLKQTILAAAVAGLVLAVAPAAQAMEFVSIGEPKNPDTEVVHRFRGGSYGSVPYEYRIGKHEVMIAEWEKSGLGDGDEAEWKKAVGPGAPAVNVTWHEAVRFANWMTEKYGGGNPYYKDDGDGNMSFSTEGENPISHYDWAVTKGKGTTYFIPTEDEWFKAAYYGCGILSSGAHMLLFRSGTLGYYDLSGKRETENYGGIRPGCWINTIAADGLVLAPDATAGCTCSYLTRAWFALQPTALEDDSPTLVSPSANR